MNDDDATPEKNLDLSITSHWMLIKTSPATVALSNHDEVFSMSQVSMRKVYSFEHEVDAAAATVFPLLCPVREREWVAGWQADLLYSTSGFIEQDCVFRVPKNGYQTLWSVAHYRPEQGELTFVIHHEDHYLEHLHIHARVIAASRCRLTWRRVFTALDPVGECFLNQYTRTQFDAAMQGLADQLSRHLADTPK